MEIVELRLVVHADLVNAIGKYAPKPSIACRFHVLTWFGCTLCLTAISWIVLSPRSASNATRALKSAENRRRFVISYSSVIRWNTP